jgi:hypothetical protein
MTVPPKNRPKQERNTHDLYDDQARIGSRQL